MTTRLEYLNALRRTPHPTIEGFYYDARTCAEVEESRKYPEAKKLRFNTTKKNTAAPQKSPGKFHRKVRAHLDARRKNAPKNCDVPGSLNPHKGVARAPK